MRSTRDYLPRTVKLTAEQIAALNAIARETEQPVGTLLRRYVRDGLRRDGWLQEPIDVKNS